MSLLQKGFVEALHTLGVFTLVFHVLPYLHPLQGLAFMVASTLLSATADLLSALRAARAIPILKSILAFLLQSCSVGLCVVFIFLKNSDVGLTSASRDEELTVQSDNVVALYARAGVCAVLLSSRWLNNYWYSTGTDGSQATKDDVGCSVSMDGELPQQARLVTSVDNTGKREQGSRAVLPLLLSLVRLAVGLIYGVAYRLVQDSVDVLLSDDDSPPCSSSMTAQSTSAVTNVTFSALQNNTGAISTLSGVSSVSTPLCNGRTLIPEDFWTRYGCAFVHVVACGLCYHLAVTACRLRMQRTSFSLPLTLAPPLTFVLFAMAPGWASVRDWPDVMMKTSMPETSFRWWMTVAAFVSGWLSNLVLASHIFTHIPPERLMFIER